MTQKYDKPSMGHPCHLWHSELRPGQSIQATVPQTCTPGAISDVCGTKVYLPGVAVGKEPSALANLTGANMPSVTCLAHSYPLKYASMGWKTENKAWLCSLLCWAEMAGKVPPTQLWTTRVLNKQNLTVSQMSHLMLCEEVLEVLSADTMEKI